MSQISPQNPDSWFYADANNQPVGPLPLNALQQLFSAGIITSHTLVIPEGGETWQHLSDVTGETAASTAPNKRGQIFRKRSTWLLIGIAAVTVCFIVVLASIVPSIGTKQMQTAQSSAEIPDDARFGVPKGAPVFTDRKGVLELNEIKNRPDSPEKKSAYAELDVRQKADGLLVTLSADCVVRILQRDEQLGFYQVEAEKVQEPNPQRFWVHKSILEDAKSLTGSRIITGYRIFRGKEGMSLNEDVDVLTLLDLVVALYDGRVTEEQASECIFMPAAQRTKFDDSEVESVLDDYIIYVANYDGSYNRPGVRGVHFAMPRSDGNDPLGSGPVRIIGRKEFTTRDGTVMSIPVVEIQKGIK